MLNSISLLLMIAEEEHRPISTLTWMIQSLGSLTSVMVLVSGALIFGGACYLVATKRRPAVLAAYLVLLPLPVLIAFCGIVKGMISSFSVLAMADIVVTQRDWAGGVGGSLVEIFFAMLITAPSYFTLAFGLLLRTLNPPTDSIPPTPIRSEIRGVLPATT